MGGYYARIAKSLERIADALEKMTDPSVDVRELIEKIKGTLQAPGPGKRYRSRSR